MREKLIITIDGPAGSGKSTTAKLLAKHLTYLYLDTGAMYRAITWKAIKYEIPIEDEKRIIDLANKSVIELYNNNGQQRVLIDGIDITKEIRTIEVSKRVSSDCAILEVREALVKQQRIIGKNGGIVVEGRDVGTIVFPDADIKIYLICSIFERAKRRQTQLEKQGEKIELIELMQNIELRDQKDTTRKHSPLKKAENAIIIDTTNLTVEQQVEKILTLIEFKHTNNK